MERIKSFRQGQIWLNVFTDKNGELALTINKSYPTKDGQWKRTPFFRPQRNDLMNIVKLLGQFLVFREEEFQQGCEA